MSSTSILNGLNVTASSRRPVSRTIPMSGPSTLSKDAVDAKSEEATREAIRHMLTYAMAGAGAGVGLRGLSSMGEIFNPRPIVSPVAQGTPTVVSLSSEHDRKRPGAWLQPTAVGPVFKQAVEQPMAGPANSIYDNVVKPLGLHQVADMPFNNITVPGAKPLYGAGAVAATAAGVGGGYKLLDWLLKRKRKNELDGETSAAEQEYLGAIKDLRQTKYAALDEARGQIKQARVDELQSPLSPAGWTGQNAANAAGTLASTWGGLAMAAGIPAAAAGYALARENSNARALREALLLRARNLQRAQPAPVVLTRPEGELEQQAA